MARHPSHNKLLKIGMDGVQEGLSLNEIQARLTQRGANKEEAIGILREIEPEAKRVEAKKLEEKKAAGKNAGAVTQTKNKSGWLWIVLLVLVVIVLLYMLFSGTINLG